MPGKVTYTFLQYVLIGDHMTTKKVFGRKDGSQTGKKSGGRGRNQTDDCRHPEVKRNRK